MNTWIPIIIITYIVSLIIYRSFVINKLLTMMKGTWFDNPQAEKYFTLFGVVPFLNTLMVLAYLYGRVEKLFKKLFNRKK